jgi:DNA modification methylase
MSVKILQGDCIEQLKTLPDQSVNCCVTSPPYWGLRDYGTGKLQIGLEITPQEYIEKIVLVFREVRRVLRGDGTLWLNLGDTYSAQRWTKKGETTTPAQPMNGMSDTWRAIAPTKESGLPDKNLVGIPWRVAFALQADGWYLRQDIIWHKPNPMPESVRDRCTKAHEYIFLMTKNPNYYFDNEAIKVESKQDWGTRDRTNGKYHNSGTGLQPHSGLTKSYEKANKRSVWSVNVKPYKEAHFATYPAELIEPCILAGCPVGGTVLDPFGGSGTTAHVAVEHGRNAILCELNPEYIKLINKRIAEAQPLLQM